jgi:hypothetical protein
LVNWRIKKEEFLLMINILKNNFEKVRLRVSTRNEGGGVVE